MALISIAIIVLAVIGLYMGAVYLVWLLWTTVMPAIFVTAPEQFTHPDYFIFLGFWILIAIISGKFFKVEIDVKNKSY